MTHAHREVMLRFRSSVDASEWFTHPELRPKLVEAAEDRGSNVTDVIIEALSEHYGVEYDLTGRRSTADPGAPEMTVRIPPALHATIKRSIADVWPARSVPREILRVLCLRFDLEHEAVAA